MAKKKTTGPRAVVCYHCGHCFEVSVRAMTGSCPGCYGMLMIDDVVVKNTQSYRTLQTCGKLIVQARGRVIADLITASDGVELIGKIEAKEYRGGPVHIGKRASWSGNCHAPAITVETGGTILKGYLEIIAQEKPKPSKKSTATPSNAGMPSHGRSQTQQPA